MIYLLHIKHVDTGQVQILDFQSPFFRALLVVTLSAYAFLELTPEDCE